MQCCLPGAQPCTSHLCCSMINTLAVVLLIPVYDKGLAPLLRKLKRPIKLLQRIGR